MPEVWGGVHAEKDGIASGFAKLSRVESAMLTIGGGVNPKNQCSG